jgi:hypothetical protein
MRATDATAEWMPPPEFLRYRLPDCDDVCHVREFLNDTSARAYYAELATQTQWADESIQMFGRAVVVPRRCAWFGDVGVTYGYSR